MQEHPRGRVVSLAMNAADQTFLSRTQVLLRGLYNSGLCVLYHDATLQVRIVENQPKSWPSTADILAGGDLAIFDADTAERVLAVKRCVLRTGEAARMEVAIARAEAGPEWFDLHIEADYDDADDIQGLFVSATDITHVKSREATLRGLLYEVSHRSRNMLAILQSILSHTARHSRGIAQFERTFRGRIASLAHSQDLVTQANWRGVAFRSLVLRQLAEFRSSNDTELMVDGADPDLNPNEALYLGLALHELGANSATFGVLASGRGRISVSAEQSDGFNRMDWTEELSEPLAVPTSRGFGRTVLEVVVSRAIDGEASYAIEPQRVAYSIKWPSWPSLLDKRPYPAKR